MTLDKKESAKSSAAYPNEKNPFQDKKPTQEKKEAVNLNIKSPTVVSGEITMHELLKAQRKIDENNRKAGIAREPLTRPRSKQNLPIANK